MSIYAFRSKDFHLDFSRIAEFRALVPSGTPLMACTVTATHSIQEEIVSTLVMSEVETVTLSPNCFNIMYVARRRRTDWETDFSESLRP